MHGLYLFDFVRSQLLSQLITVKALRSLQKIKKHCENSRCFLKLFAELLQKLA